MLHTTSAVEAVTPRCRVPQASYRTVPQPISCNDDLEMAGNQFWFIRKTKIYKSNQSTNPFSQDVSNIMLGLASLARYNTEKSPTTAFITGFIAKGWSEAEV